MADICVVYLSNDESLVERLVDLLRKDWGVWWARDLAHGDWEEHVRSEIPQCKVLVPVLSGHAKGERKAILKDEMRFAKQHKKPILPLVIGPADIPFGFGDLSYTPADTWTGDEAHHGFQQLRAKIAATIDGSCRGEIEVRRPAHILVRDKKLLTPTFAFSLSSHETQVMPHEGLMLLQLLQPDAILVSAYDVWKRYRRNSQFRADLRRLSKSDSIFFLDSGNYESYRKRDFFSKRENPTGWQRSLFWKAAALSSPDVAFTFDALNPKGTAEQIASRVSTRFRADERALSQRDFLLCPIVHLPLEYKGTIEECASQITLAVAKNLNPSILAIPERELGDGLRQKVKTVRAIRSALDTLGRYCPLHLLGTGNPLSMIALAAAGADSFDGLEWCRTVVDYPTGFLFHFQQFECFNPHFNRVKDQRVKYLIENPTASYTSRALSYNVDFFKDWTRTMQSMIHSGQVEHLLRLVPNIGQSLYADICK